MDIGLKIKELRKKKKMSLEELSSKIGVSRQQVGYYEQGKNQPPIDKLQAIASALEVDLAEIVNEAYSSDTGLESENARLRLELEKARKRIDELTDVILKFHEKK